MTARAIDPRKLQLAKAATTAASTRYNIGGIKKAGPKPVTLPKLKCLELSTD